MATGLLIVNLGSPVSPSTRDVRRYLQEFLSDQNVITMPKMLWQPILRGFILPFRSWRSATFYQHEWTKAGSPLIAYTQVTRDRLRKKLPDWDVQMAMTYGGEYPIGETLQGMAARGDHPIVVIPLFPEYTQSTTKTILDKVAASGVKTLVIDQFYDQPAYLQLLAQQLDDAYSQDDYDTVILSYHGIPTSMVRHGDPYQQACEATTAGVKRYLKKVPQEKVEMCYQSKFGPVPWLKPYLRNRLMALAALGKRRVLVTTPSFVADCLETLEENDVQNYQTFRANGGKVFKSVRPMNGCAPFCDILASLAKEKVAAEAQNDETR
ncbi:MULTISPECIES: ferrochelatase [Lacticaseibacillus]|uniref:Coproporphyrin III ferrochelatase n=1 Tax=Lacticaseibacillus zeae subsp. silagei TaxID=3068307 RepID=A0ABD7Z790_LACZE|nr:MULTISPECIES: ferrochelatase [Lacticaseibacillus]OFS00443.1 ferrochelatase [Lactobacillus sp. HMSC068F07]MDE3282940.1 ferrochelatase [Lacticaseibacillus casei]MDE3315656.1 ferrochelatase [Lacticaseibacillus zeae]WLV82712.1 ferrochelatase [Lacticaseibacillus sp. NCIMB 15475]WLV87457.1 ferrochelatase [Lacticaseibacillus sp. NCIMB 15474]